ncbi:uncharacterized protein LOC143223454 [Tachypleus tridentatus]|uniref:uncharacterized protein LOC143223454 n=1 Tax=Tachypleus tridentatus TaxID=6853 RepID=UPI003FD4CF31
MGNSNSRSEKLARIQSSASSPFQRDDGHLQQMPKIRVLPQLPSGRVLRVTENGMFLQNEGTITGKKAQLFMKQQNNDINPELSKLLQKRLKSEETYFRGSSVERGFFGSKKAYSDPDIVHSVLNWDGLLQAEKDATDSIYNTKSLVALSPSESKIKSRKKTQEFGWSHSSSLPRDFHNVRHLNTGEDTQQFNKYKRSLFSKWRNMKKEDKVKGIFGFPKTPIIPAPDYSTESDELQVEKGDDNGYCSQETKMESLTRKSFNEDSKSKSKGTLYDLNKRNLCDKNIGESAVETSSYVRTSPIQEHTKYEGFSKQLCVKSQDEDIHQEKNQFTRNPKAFSGIKSNKCFKNNENSFDHCIIGKNNHMCKGSDEHMETEIPNKSYALMSTKNNRLLTPLPCVNQSEFDYQTSDIACKLGNLNNRDKSLVHVKENNTKLNKAPLRYAREIYSSADTGRLNNQHVEKLYKDQPNLSFCAPRVPSESSLSGEEDTEIKVKIKPILPRRRLQPPRFSPTEVWKSLFSDCYQSEENTEEEEEISEIKLHRTNRLVAPPRIGKDRCGDSGISPDVGNPALLNETIEDMFSDIKQRGNLQNLDLFSEEAQENITSNRQLRPLQMTLIKDLDESERKNEGKEFKSVSNSAKLTQPDQNFMYNLHTDYNVFNRINASQSGSQELLPDKNFERHKKSIKKSQQQLNSLRNLKKCLGFREKLPTTESCNNVDSNWQFNRSVPYEIDKTENVEILKLDYGHLPKRNSDYLVEENVQQRHSSIQKGKECFMYLPGYGATHNGKHQDTSTLQREAKQIYSKKNKLTFQNAFQREQTHGLESEAEIEWMSKVEEEFRKQRKSEKMSLCSQLQALNQDTTVCDLEKYEATCNCGPNYINSSNYQNLSPDNEKNKVFENHDIESKVLLRVANFPDSEDVRRMTKMNYRNGQLVKLQPKLRN